MFWLEVERLTAEGEYDKVLSKFEDEISVNPTSELYYQRGRLLWKLGRKTEAMSDYGRAIELDPESPAVAALQMAREVMDFYNRDLYNP